MISQESLSQARGQASTAQLAVIMSNVDAEEYDQFHMERGDWFISPNCNENISDGMQCAWLIGRVYTSPRYYPLPNDFPLYGTETWFSYGCHLSTKMRNNSLIGLQASCINVC